MIIVSDTFTNTPSHCTVHIKYIFDPPIGLWPEHIWLHFMSLWKALNNHSHQTDVFKILQHCFVALTTILLWDSIRWRNLTKKWINAMHLYSAILAAHVISELLNLPSFLLLPLPSGGGNFPISPGSATRMRLQPSQQPDSFYLMLFCAINPVWNTVSTCPLVRRHLALDDRTCPYISPCCKT